MKFYYDPILGLIYWFDAPPMKVKKSNSIKNKVADKNLHYNKSVNTESRQYQRTRHKL